MPESYLEATNPSAAKAFPYLVRETAHGESLTFDPAFHIMHWHDDLQFLYAADGVIDVQTLREHVTVQRGEGIFINKDVVHCIEAGKDAHYYSFLYPANQLRFLPGSPANDDLAAVLDGDALPLCLLTEATEWERHALALLRELLQFTTERPAAYALNVLVRLLALVLLLREHAPLAPAKADDVNAIRTKQVLQYIAAHYAEDITLDDLAQSSACSKSACLRAFRLLMKTTPYKYLIEYRLEQAALLLRQTNEPIGAIAETVGFHHFSLFGKSFKQKTGMTPKDYRIHGK